MRIKVIFASLLLIALCGVSAFAQKASPSTVQPVRDIDNPARQPFFRTVTATDLFLDPVPAGKVLVLEYVNGRSASLETGAGAVVLYVYNQGVMETINIFGPSYYTEHVSSNKTYINQPVKLYIPAGRTMQLKYQGDSSPAFYSMTLTGHYVDVQ